MYHCKFDVSFLFHFVDTRLGYCFSERGENGLCENSNGMVVTKSSCCCSMNVGWADADGDACELCPEKGSDEWKYICPKGIGFDRTAGELLISEVS